MGPRAHSPGDTPTDDTQEVPEDTRAFMEVAATLASASGVTPGQLLDEAAPRADEKPHPDTSEPTQSRSRADLVGGRYLLTEKLGEGATGAVFKVTHRDLGKQFAMKILRGTLELSRARELFLHEARVASSLDHPHIVTVTDFGVDPHHGAYLVMELLVGETMRARLDRRGGFGLVESCNAIYQLLDALRFLHQRKVVHCDIKPDNLFLGAPAEEAGNDQLKVLDFGLAALTSAAAEVSGAHQGGRTAGTPPYLAPERLRGAPPSVASDLYSVGAVFYELATGFPTHQATSLSELMHLVLSDAPAPPVDYGVAPSLSELIMALLERDPARRIATADDAVARLLKEMDRLGIRRSVTPQFHRSRSHAVADRFERFAFPLAVASAFGRVRSFNQGFTRLFRLSREELVGRHLAELFPEEKLLDVLGTVVSATGQSFAWLRLPTGKLHIAKVAIAGEIELHVTVIGMHRSEP